LSLEPRPEIDHLPGSVHGGPDYAELKSLGLSVADVLDFSVCCNPYPPPAGVRRSLRTVNIDRYPDSSASGLRQKLAQSLGISTENILPGSGSTELIRLIALTFFRAGDEVLILKPTYGEYDLAGRIMGAGIVEYRWDIHGSRPKQIVGLIEIIRRQPLKAVFICHPNNPTGLYFSRDEIKSILAACRGSLLVLDEAYISFTAGAWSALDLLERGNVILLRSMTKDYALAGLRLGYLLASEEIIRDLRRVCPPWNVNAAAQAAGCAALDAPGYLARSQDRIARSKNFLLSELAKIGLSTEPSQAHFFLVHAGSGSCGGSRFRTALLKQGILVRDCASFGLPEYIRIAPRTLAECRRFIHAVRRVVRIEKAAQKE
jgi:histidinol-phosphate aminotransferase